MALPKIFFLYLDDDKDDAIVCNELFEWLNNWMELAASNSCFITTGKKGITHIIFLDRDTEGGDCAEKIDRLTKKFKGAIKLLTQNNIMRGEEISSNYQLAVKSQKSKSEASITFYLEKIEDK